VNQRHPSAWDAAVKSTALLEMPDSSLMHYPSRLVNSISIKKKMATILYFSGYALHKIKRLARKSFVVLMYHRVVPKSARSICIQPGMYVTPETLDMHLSWIKSHFQVLSPNDVLTLLRGSSLKTNGRPRSIITFDDGWLDFYLYAYPLLLKHDLPALVFLPTNFIGTDNRFWTDRLSKIIQANSFSKHKTKPGLSKYPEINAIEAAKGSLDEIIEVAIASLKPLPNGYIEKILEELSSRNPGDIPEQGRVFMNWAEIRQLKESGFVYFGSHTSDHCILTTLPASIIESQLRKSKAKLLQEKLVDDSSVSFCYPNGNFNSEILKIVQSCGYHFAFTTEQGWNDSNTNPYALRRIGLHNDIAASQGMLACRLASIF
jgi:peptidoglycan/xylan/chitin deacetylase (PgdA/CDA1 family)